MHRRAAEPTLMQPGQPVQGVAFRHPYAGAPGTGGATCVFSYSARMSIRRWCRSAFDHSAARKASTISNASLDGVHAAADAHHLRVVVLAGQRRGLGAPRQSAAHAGHLVRGDLLAVARAADHDAEALGIGDGLHRGGDAERRVVVLGVVGVGAAVDRLVTGLA